MNLRIYISFIFLQIVFMQTSSLSLYGFGEYIDSYDAASIGMGDMKLFSGTENDFILSSPASYSNLEHSNLSMSIAFNNLQSKEISKLTSNNFHFFSFIFPMNNRFSFSFGMNPVFRSELSVKENDYNFVGADESTEDYDDDGTYDPFAYKTDYDILGGISEFHTSFSSKITKNILFGVKIGKLFGTNQRDYLVKYYTVSYSQDGNLDTPLLYNQSLVQNIYEYSSNNYKLDFRVSTGNKYNYKYDFAFSFEQSNPFKINLNSEYSSIGESNQITFISDNGFEKYGIGFNMNLNKTSGFVLESHYFNSINSIDITNIFNNNGPDIQSLHIGYYSRFDGNDNNWDSSNLRFGLYSKEYKFLENNFIEHGMTFGIGFQYLELNTIDLGIKLGFRDSEYYEFKDERFLKLYITLSSGEKWFVKDRRIHPSGSGE